MGLSIKDKLRSTLPTEQADPVMGRRSVRVAFQVSFSLHSATWILFRERAPSLTIMTQRISVKFHIGVAYNANAPDAKLNPAGSYFTQTQSASRRGIIVSFSSDRI